MKVSRTVPKESDPPAIIAGWDTVIFPVAVTPGSGSGVSGVSGISGVSGVSGVSGISGVSGVSVTAAGGSLPPSSAASAVMPMPGSSVTTSARVRSHAVSRLCVDFFIKVSPFQV